MEQKNATLRILISDILELKKKNDAVRATSICNKQSLTENFYKGKVEYDRILNSDINYTIKQKHNLEYVFLFEQFNLKNMPYENSIKKCDLYENRLEQILKYINAKYDNNKSVSKEKTLEYAINSAIVAEAINFYDKTIEEARQYRIVYSKFRLYLDYLKKIEDPSYDKYIGLLPSDEELAERDEIIESTQIEKSVLIDILRETKFDMSRLKMQDLTSQNIRLIINLMYPSFKDELAKIQKKGKQVA